MNRWFKIGLIICLYIGLGYGQASASNSVSYYFDGQRQYEFAKPIHNDGHYWFPAAPLLKQVEKQIKYDTKTQDSQEEVSVRTIDALMADLESEQVVVGDREMISDSVLEDYGYSVYHYDQNNSLHVSSPELMTIAGITIGSMKHVVDTQLTGVKWDTAYGKKADVIGYFGEMIDLHYTDRYGIERSGQVPELQIEVTDGVVSYMIVSSPQFSTSKGIVVGDRLTDVIRSYGTNYYRERIDGKEVLIYDVEFGSIWFIANSERKIERIGYWDHWVRGF
ncbi:hypothetical protein [Desertibacillus haloalkaliphilus]|uniref:hypothetical protein n=1 Tax=Desertibacillus haloalkaliphilus TaxID=1328930 RepID=UPI001C27AB25|nr:hypothetical protein [Desertibacillus haloalkaliphilus]MBU8908373.1 hypothetical protein [Desertibacillus haloalkaliphilus]